MGYGFCYLPKGTSIAIRDLQLLPWFPVLPATRCPHGSHQVDQDTRGPLGRRQISSTCWRPSGPQFWKEAGDLPTRSFMPFGI